MTSSKEKSLRKKLGGVGIATLALAPLTGPFMPIYLAGAGAIFAGVAGREVLDRDCGGNEETTQERNSVYPESPGTSIARREPKIASDLMKDLSKERTYKESLNRGYLTTEKILNTLPKGALDDAKGVRVTLERSVGWGFFSSGEEYNLKIKIKR